MESGDGTVRVESKSMDEGADENCSISRNVSTQHFSLVQNLTNLEHITLPQVLDCLVDRFLGGNFYTFAGDDLISLNPCSTTPDSHYYHRSKSRDYLLHSQNQSSQEGPHVYSVGWKCLENLRRTGNDQVVVVSGDTGAGKTTAIQQLLRYFIHNDEPVPNEEPSVAHTLQQKIYCSTLILESFGNASTAANPNSSRFGRFLHLKYGVGAPGFGSGSDSSAGSGSILSSRIQTCLLEKHRVSKCQSNERNFHIFYYAVVGLKKGLFQRLASNLQKQCTPHLGKDILITESDEDWNAKLSKMIPPGFLENVELTDEGGFANFLESMKALNFSASELESILHIIFGLMVLLNLKFRPVGTRTSRVQDDEDDKENTQKIKLDTTAKATISSDCNNLEKSKSYFRLCTIGIENEAPIAKHHQGVVSALETIFGLDFEALEESLVARRFCAGRRKSSVRKAIERESECGERLAALVSTLYDALFHYVLRRVNDALSPNDLNPDLDPKAKISLLDLYGFEKLVGQNHFEQLCINYANERLHQVHILHARRTLVEVECWSEAPPPGPSCSTSVLDQLGMEIASRLSLLHTALFATLNEACVLNRNGSDESVYNQLATRTKAEGDDFIKCGRLYERKCEFLVRHYASDVIYSLRGMVDKNRDHVPSEVLELLGQSSSHLLGKILGCYSGVSVCGANNGRIVRGSKEKRTVLDRFKSSVDGLVRELDPVSNNNAGRQDVHFVRCIRPNHQLEKGRIDRKLVETQLFSQGIVNFVKITQNGFPIRVSKGKFLERFGGALARCFHGDQGEAAATGSGDDDEKENKLLKLLKLGGFFSGEEVRLGKSIVFLREETWAFLSRLNAVVLTASVRRLQRSWRKHQTKLKEEAKAQELKAKQAEAEDLRLYTCERTLNWLSAVQKASLMEVETSFLRSLHSLERQRRQKALEPLEEPVPVPVGPSGDLKSSLESSNNWGNGTEATVTTGRGKGAGSRRVLKESGRGDWGSFGWLERWCKKEGLFLSQDGGVVSRRQGHQGRFRVYLRPTALGNSHVLPRRLMPQGLPDLLLPPPPRPSPFCSAHFKTN